MERLLQDARRVYDRYCRHPMPLGSKDRLARRWMTLPKPPQTETMALQCVPLSFGINEAYAIVHAVGLRLQSPTSTRKKKKEEKEEKEEKGGGGGGKLRCVHQQRSSQANHRR
eukprot:m.247157 g.247157  ORF g.247157 m.247157 type:complete len:113 (+) comp15390_c0_seq2:4039-4377(+)